MKADPELGYDSQRDVGALKRTRLSRWRQCQGRGGDSITNRGRITGHADEVRPETAGNRQPF